MTSKIDGLYGFVKRVIRGGERIEGTVNRIHTRVNGVNAQLGQVRANQRHAYEQGTRIEDQLAYVAETVGGEFIPDGKGGYVLKVPGLLQQGDKHSQLLRTIQGEIARYFAGTPKVEAKDGILTLIYNGQGQDVHIEVPYGVQATQAGRNSGASNVDVMTIDGEQRAIVKAKDGSVISLGDNADKKELRGINKSARKAAGILPYVLAGTIGALGLVGGLYINEHRGNVQRGAEAAKDLAATVKEVQKIQNVGSSNGQSSVTSGQTNINYNSATNPNRYGIEVVLPDGKVLIIPGPGDASSLPGHN